ncbi:hypothetical protein K2X85_08850 [bacterium]|jgi:hypothetical protein|nr:hypothetical protein [bacterium]
MANTSALGTVIRVVLAGVLAGAAVFNAGFAGHVVFGWPERNIGGILSEDKIREVFSAEKVAPGMYFFPDMNPDLPPEQRADQEKVLQEKYKQGPSGMLVIHPPGSALNMNQFLSREFATNVGCYLLAAWVVSLLAPQRSFATRIFVVMAISLFSWLSIVVSYGIWYRFTLPFVMDELFNALLEGAVGGLVIALIIRSTPARSLNSSESFAG